MRALARWTFAVLLLLTACLAVWDTQRRLPPGVHINGAWQSVPAEDVRFLRDQTAADARGQPLVEEQIQPALLQIIARAQAFVLLDTGLLGDLPATGPAATRLRKAAPLAGQLVEALLRRKREQPGLRVLVLVDPATASLALADTPAGTGAVQSLRDGGMDVVAVDERRLRDPNPFGRAVMELCCGWWSRPGPGGGNWPNPVGVGPAGVDFGAWVRLRAYQRSHRQLLLADDGAGALLGVIVSRSMHAEAGIHSATALQLRGAALEPMLEAEFVVAQFSGWTDAGAMQALARRTLQHEDFPASDQRGDARARVVSEGALGAALVERIGAAGSGAAIDVAALYLAERGVVRALIDAAHRGAAVRVLLDPGRDGYGYSRSGMPNRQVATELLAASDGAVRVRWYRTHGEQFSPGFVLVREGGRSWLLVGSAELSRRDLDDFNLAAGFITDLDAGSAAAGSALDWFETLWFNRAGGGVEYSADADVYADASQVNYWYARALEANGGAFD
jgi:hypothetical protein